MGVGTLEAGRGLRRAVFLDRDGVLNRALLRDGCPHPPQSLAELEILPGVTEALARLREAGFLLIVVTNQPDVARGQQQRHVVEEINRALSARLPLDEVCVCYHDTADGCTCRKPAPGLLLAAAARWRIDLEASYMIGDRWKDIEAGRRAGCRTILIDHHYAEAMRGAPDYTTTSLLAAVDWVTGPAGPQERRTHARSTEQIEDQHLR